MSARFLLMCVFAVVTVMTPLRTNAQAPELAYRDGNGRWQWTDASDRWMVAGKGAHSTETISGTFTVIYEDLAESTGAGFDDPDRGAARRATLWAVLDYLSSVLDVPGSADLLVMRSQTDGAGALAAGGPFLIPMSGFQGGLVYEHLTSGVDPIAEAVDGTLSVDFGYAWNSETDDPTPNEQDLYTTLLHEVTHALGFLSIANGEAQSAVFNADGRGLFSFLDSLLLRRSTDTRLFLPGGQINAIADDLSSGDLVFAGDRARQALGEYPRIFAPDPFRDGSSIGHWSTANGTDSVMLPALSPGSKRRSYTAWEIQALADLGYDVAVCGDGFVAGSEECDDSNANDDDGCTRNCELTGVTAPDGGVPSADPSGIPTLSPEGSGDRPPPASSSGCSVRGGPGGSFGSVLLVVAWLGLQRRRSVS